MTAYEDWREGTLEPSRALHALCAELGEVESELAPLEQERASLRAQLSEIVSALGDKAVVPGFGELRITPASKVTTYDRRQLEALMIWLVQHDQPGYAQRILNCRSESMRAGGLRVVREKEQAS